VLLLIASQYTFEFHRENKNRVRKEQERKDYEQARAQRIVDNPGYQPTVQPEKTTTVSSEVETKDMELLDPEETVNNLTEQDRANRLEELEKTESFKNAKQKWKEENPEATIKEYKDAYITGKIDELPWTEYIQNSEQGNSSIWQRIRKKLDE
jgi:hypothetical protein